MFTIFLFLTITYTTGQWAHKLTDGIEIEIDEETVIIQGELTTFITITKPEYPSILLRNIQDLMAILRTETSHPWAVIALSTLQIAEEHITTPISWWQPNRNKRGIVNGVGNAMQFLFGTATDSELKEVQFVLAAMERNQEATVQWIDHLTVAINHTYTEIQINRDQINALIKEVRGIFTELNNGLSGVLRQIRMVRNQQATSDTVTQMLTLAQQYARHCDLWQERKTHLEAGRLTESLLPPSTLKEILSSTIPHPGATISPLQWYYEHTPISPVWNDDVLIYKVKLPLISQEQWHFVTFTTWPVPVDSWQATLILPHYVLRDTRSGDLDISPRCQGKHPRVCRRGLITQAATYGCLTHLLAAKPSYDPTCTIEMQHRIPIDAIHPHQHSGFVLTTGGTTLIRRCAGEAESTTVLQAGVFHIELNFPCSLHGTDWTLRTIFSRKLNKTLHTEPARPPVNFTITDLLIKSETSTPIREQLSQLGNVSKIQLQVRSLPLSRSNLVPNSEHFQWLHLLWLCALPPSLTLAYLKRRLCQKTTKKDTTTIHYVPGTDITADGVVTSEHSPFQFGKTNLT